MNKSICLVNVKHVHALMTCIFCKPGGKVWVALDVPCCPPREVMICTVPIPGIFTVCGWFVFWVAGNYNNDLFLLTHINKSIYTIFYVDNKFYLNNIVSSNSNSITTL